MVDSVGCPIVVGDAATNLVGTAYEKFQGFANKSYQLAERNLNDLGQFVLTPVTFNASFTPQQALSGFVRPVAPDVPSEALKFNAPGLPPQPPTQNPLGTFQPAPVPKDASAAPSLRDVPLPRLGDIKDPGDAPELRDVAFPSKPTINVPDAPWLENIDLPTPIDITLPTFDVDAPELDAPIPDGNFSFTPEQYVSEFLDSLKSKLDTMVGNPAGLPSAVAQALRDRNYVEADREEARAVQSAYDEFAARGFSEPSGLLNARVVEARQRGLEKRSSASRDVYIQDEQTAIENLRFAIGQAVSLESRLMQAHETYTQYALESAKYALDAAVAIFNARVRVFNARVQSYTADAQVFRDLIGAESTKVELYSAQLRAAHEKGQFNQQKLDAYEAQLRGVQTLVTVYREQVQAVNSEISANKTILEAYSTKVGAFSEQVRAQSLQWDGYRSQLQGEATKVQIYEASTQAYASRVRAWSESENLKLERQKLNLAFDDSRLEQWKSKIQLYDTQLKGELARLEATSRAYGIKADVYKAAATVEQAATAADDRSFQLNLAQQQAIVDTELKRANFDLDQLKYVTENAVEVKKSIASVSAQLASASMSAVNFHAGSSSSLSQSYGCGTNISYSASLEDYNAPPE